MSGGLQRREAEKLATPAIAVVGSKKSGKTSLVQLMIERLTKAGYRVGCIKHIPHPDFTIDTPAKDTWRYSESGARKVVSVAPSEVAIIEKGDISGVSLEGLASLLSDIDVIILEGFRDLVKGRSDILTLLTVKAGEDPAVLGKEFKGLVGAVSLQRRRDVECLTPDEAVDLVEKEVSRSVELLRRAKRLPGFNCGACGYESCLDHAEAIVNGKSRVEDCQVLSGKISVKIDGKALPMKPFVQDVVRSTVLGLLSTLKGVKLRGDELLVLELRRAKVRSAPDPR
jgi:molybdopterin-guanine dinucleotide biosynthesis protein B